MTISLGLSSPPRGGPLPDLPPTRKVWPGFALATVFLVSEFFELPLQVADGVSAIQYLFVIAGWFYYLACVHRLHAILAPLSWTLSSPPAPYPVEPASAVGRHFIPFFNLFWIVRWPLYLTEFVNLHLRSEKMISGVLLGLLALFGGVFGRLFDAALALYLLFWIMAYQSKKVRLLAAETAQTFGAASVFE